MEVYILDVLRHRLYKYCSLEVELLCFECFCYRVLACRFCSCNQELLSFVLCADQADDGLWSAVTEDNLSLSVYYVLLKVVGDSFCGTEILHCFRNFHSQLFAKKEERINSGSCGKNNGCMIKDIYSM